MSGKNNRLNDISQEQGSSSWVTVLPVTYQTTWIFIIKIRILGCSLPTIWASTRTTSKSLW